MSRREGVALLAALAVAVGVSAWSPYDRLTWWLEAFPVLIGVPLLLATRRRMPLTPLVYRLLALHAGILLLGGHYSYARVPLGFWLQDGLHLARNPYDRVGHLIQGFVPALLTRELLLRASPLRRGRWLFFLVTCVCLALSAVYELIEACAALLLGQSAESFLGTQGDVWDTQWDMFLALLGALTAQLALGRAHDRALQRSGAAGA